LIRGHETPAFERRDATALAQGALGRKLSAREVSAYWMGRTLTDIRADPTGWAGLLARKTLLVWNRYEVADVESLYIYGEFSSALKVLGLIWHFGVLCPLAAVGLWVTWNERRKLWVYYALIASMAASVAVFYVLARYRFPLVPLLIPFAAAGCVRAWDLLRCGSYRRLIGPALVAGVVAAVVNWPMVNERRLDALGWMNLGVAVAEEGDLESATGYFRRAVSGYEDSAEANNNLAMALALQGGYAEAIPHYEAALAGDAALMGVSYNLGVALERVGRAEEALVQYKRAVALDPSDTEAREAVLRLGERK
jgi:tetratricopeptide (TPR) repeat protein